jgi:hypothetical protein
MIPTCGRAPQPLGARALSLPGWQVLLAAAGDGSARSCLRDAVSVIAISEGRRAGRLPTARPARFPLVEAHLGEAGDVLVRWQDAPAVLLIPGDGAPARPLTPDGGTATVVVGPGGRLFACSPSLLDALEPAEILALPRLLRTAPDPAALLQRWVTATTLHGTGGAAAALAQHVGVHAAESPLPERFTTV